VSKASIPGGPTLYLNSGSTLNLTCNVLESPVPPDYVFWFHNGRVINYDVSREISVHTERVPKMTSRLLISNAQPQDSGNYSCVPSNADQADITVHVLNGERPAPMVPFFGPRDSPFNGDDDTDGLPAVVSEGYDVLSTRDEEYNATEPQNTNGFELGIAENSTLTPGDSALQSEDVAARQNNDFVGNWDSSIGTFTETDASNMTNGTADVVPTLPQDTQDNNYNMTRTYAGNSSGVPDTGLDGNETEIVYDSENGTDINDVTELTAQQSRQSYDKEGSSNTSSSGEQLFQFGQDFDIMDLSNVTFVLDNNSTEEIVANLSEEGNRTAIGSSSNHTVDSEISDMGVSNDTAKAWLANMLKDNGFNLSMLESLTNGSFIAVGKEWNLGYALTEIVSGKNSFSKLCSNVTNGEVDALCSHVAALTEFVSALSGALRDVLLVLKACMSE
ncbi:unnamed protein product, partial [Ixodes hexagonus]